MSKTLFALFFLPLVLAAASASAQTRTINTKPAFDQVNNTIAASAALNGVACAAGAASACWVAAGEGVVAAELALEESGLAENDYEIEVELDDSYNDSGRGGGKGETGVPFYYSELDGVCY